MKAEEAQDAQIILAHAGLGITDEAHALRRQVREPVKIIMHHAIQGAGQGIDGEIPTPGIGLPVVGESDLGLPPKGFHIAPQGGDLDRLMPGHRRHRPMFDPGRDRFQAGRHQQRHHALRRQGRGDIDIVDRPADQCIAHATANETRWIALRRQGVIDEARWPFRHPGLGQRFERKNRHGATVASLASRVNTGGRSVLECGIAKAPGLLLVRRPCMI